MPEIDIVCGYTDPILGDVYCDDETQACDMAKRTDGHAWVEFWSDGNAVSRNELVHLEHVVAEDVFASAFEERHNGV